MRNGSRPYIASLSRGHDDHATFRATLQRLDAWLAAGCGRAEHGHEAAEESDRSASEDRTDGASFPHPARGRVAAKSQHSLMAPDLIQYTLGGKGYRALGCRTQSFVDQGGKVNGCPKPSRRRPLSASPTRAATNSGRDLPTSWPATVSTAGSRRSTALNLAKTFPRAERQGQVKLSSP